MKLTLTLYVEMHMSEVNEFGLILLIGLKKSNWQLKESMRSEKVEHLIQWTQSSINIGGVVGYSNECELKCW